ncbi:MAG: hypothetical protein AAFY45_33205 [Bacteroidota bacterium]
MANKNLSEFSTEELEEKLKSSKQVFIAIASIFGAILLAATFYFLNSDNDPSMLPMVAVMTLMIAALLPMINSRRAIEEELKKR